MNRSDSLVCNGDVCWVAGERTMTAQGQLHAPAPHTCPTARTLTRSLSANKTVYPGRTPGLLMHTDACWSLYVCTVSAAEPFLYTRHKDVIVAWWRFSYLSALCSFKLLFCLWRYCCEANWWNVLHKYFHVGSFAYERWKSCMCILHWCKALLSVDLKTWHV